MHSYAVFLVAFLEDFHLSRAEASIAHPHSHLVAGASSPLVGTLVDRLGPRRLVLLGGACLALGLLGSAYISALWQVIALYGLLMTLGANCLGLVVFVPLLSRWYANRRGMAISVVQSANGFARAISAPVVQLLISAVGWRHAYLAQAGFMAVLILPLAAFFRGTDPELPSRARASDGGASGRGARRGRRLDGEGRRTHAALLAPLRRLSVHGARQLPRLPPPARLRRRRGLRQALCGDRSGRGQLPRHRGDHLHGDHLRLHRARALGHPRPTRAAGPRPPPPTPPRWGACSALSPSRARAGAGPSGSPPLFSPSGGARAAPPSPPRLPISSPGDIWAPFSVSSPSARAS